MGVGVAVEVGDGGEVGAPGALARRRPKSNPNSRKGLLVLVP